MVVYTTKVTRRKLVSVILVACIAVCSVVVAVRNQSENTVSVLDAQTAALGERALKTNEDRTALLKECGWEIEEEPVEFIEVRIPDKFDGVYGQYNEIQKRQGLDLEKYSGKRVMRYTYKISNHPSGESGVVANIIVYKNKLIAADVCSPQMNGFMHGLKEKDGNIQTGEEK